MLQFGLVLFGFVWFCLVLFGLVWFGLVWFGLIWFGLVWFGLVWFGWVLVSFDFSTECWRASPYRGGWRSEELKYSAVFTGVWFDVCVCFFFRFVLVWSDLIWFRLVWPGLVWFGLVWFGLALFLLFFVWFGVRVLLRRLAHPAPNVSCDISPLFQSRRKRLSLSRHIAAASVRCSVATPFFQSRRKRSN